MGRASGGVCGTLSGSSGRVRRGISVFAGISGWARSVRRSSLNEEAPELTRVRRGRANKRDGGHRPMAVVARAVEVTLPAAFLAAAYILGQAIVDTWGN